MMKKLADINIGDLETPGFQVRSEGDAASKLTNIISTVIGFLTAVAFIYFTVQVFLGALAWITAGGDKGKVEQARAKITSGVQGVVVVIAAIFMIRLVGFIFNMDFLNIGGAIGILGGWGGQ